MTENKILMNEHEGLEEKVQHILDKIKNKISAQVYEQTFQAIIKMHKEKILPKDVLGFTKETLEEVYHYSYNLFQAGKYEEARVLFEWLRDIDTTDARFTFAIASCYHHQKKYEDAAAQYIICQYLNPEDPTPSFHLYDCFIKTNYLFSALSAIAESLVLIDRDPKYQFMKSKAELELKHVQSLLAEKQSAAGF
jgi:type III secretion system low calcium response chaperone LcrH/SycD